MRGDNDRMDKGFVLLVSSWWITNLLKQWMDERKGASSVRGDR